MRPTEAAGQAAAAGSARQARDVTVYRGLAHPQTQKALYARQLRTERHVRIHDFEFFAQPAPVSTATARKVLALYADPSSHQALAIKDTCQFHPDYALVWRDGGSERVLQVCYGCHEWKYFGPVGEVKDGVVKTDIAESAYFDRLTQWLPKQP
jgi:hypothetical protein